MLPGVRMCYGLHEHLERLWQKQRVARKAWSALAFQTAMRMLQASSRNVGSPALCSFSLLEGLTHCTDYLEYAPRRVSPSCWTLDLDLFWIPGDVLTSPPPPSLKFGSHEIMAVLQPIAVLCSNVLQRICVAHP